MLVLCAMFGGLELLLVHAFNLNISAVATRILYTSVVFCHMSNHHIIICKPCDYMI